MLSLRVEDCINKMEVSIHEERTDFKSDSREKDRLKPLSESVMVKTLEQ